MPSRRAAGRDPGARLDPPSTRGDAEGGGAVVEFALLIVFLAALLVGMIHVGTLLWSYREAGAAVRVAARDAAMSGASRHADLQTLQLLRSLLPDTSGRTVEAVIVYKVDATSSGVPASCLQASVAGVCNRYGPEILRRLDSLAFDDAGCIGDVDVAWCPSDRAFGARAIGVAVQITQQPFLRLVPGPTRFEQFAVFPLESS